MNRKQFTVISIAFLLVATSFFLFIKAMKTLNQPSPYRIVGYYSSSASRSGYKPTDINGNKVTNVNYAFATISNGKIALTAPKRDKKNFHQFDQLKKKFPHLKMIISVGGWGNSKQFSKVASTEQTRTKFADSCVAFIKKYDFNGIDIDWEYPVTGGAPGTIHSPDDKHNFTLLIKEIREKLDALNQQTGKKYLLTITGAASTGYLHNTEMNRLAAYVNYINLMTYDISGQWGERTVYNAPLYTTSHNAWSASAAVNAYLNAGVPRKKIVMGLPFYGRKYDEVAPADHGLDQHFEGNGGTLAYRDIRKNHMLKNGYKRYWDDEAKVPYLWNGSSFISYDSRKSIRYKARFIKHMGLGGAMIWQLSQDYHGTLLNALYQSLQNSK